MSEEVYIKGKLLGFEITKEQEEETRTKTNVYIIIGFPAKGWAKVSDYYIKVFGDNKLKKIKVHKNLCFRENKRYISFKFSFDSDIVLNIPIGKKISLIFKNVEEGDEVTAKIENGNEIGGIRWMG
jgi:hypothetical protein